MGKVIVVEDSPSQLTDICDKLHDAGFETEEAVSVCSAKQVIELASPLDIVLADMRLPDGQCFAILDWMKEKGYSQPFIMMSRYQDESTLQTAINNGVTRFVNKKRLDEELIVYVREQMEEQSRLAIRFDEDTYERKSEQFNTIRKDMERYARLGFRVMFTGETGAGKHCLARLYHSLCGRKGEFKRLDCASMPESKHEGALLLFGQEKTPRHPSRYDGGLLEKCKGGTIMLENVAALPEYAQGMLTYVLHHNEYEPVGALYEKKADVMFVATLNSSTDDGRTLQPDFLHYLRNREITVPALRECTDDIIPLAEFFLGLTDKDKYLSADTKSLLMRHQWPGNVSEMKAAIQDAVAKSNGNKIDAGDFDLSWHRQMPPKESAGAMSMEEYMRCRVNYVIDHATGLNNAVKLFGMSKNTLYRWMDKLGIENPFGKNE